MLRLNARPFGKIDRLRPSLLFSVQVHNSVLHWSCELLFGPSLQHVNSLSTTAFVRRSKHIPDVLTNVEKQLTKVLAAITNLQPCMLETQQHDDQWKQ